MPDIDLAAAFSDLRAGNTAAFTDIYNELKQPVYTVCRRIVRLPQQAEDLTQEVFIKLFRNPPEETVRNPRAWVFQLARNLAIDALRTRHPEQPETAAVLFRPEYVDLQLDLESAIRALPCRQREILTLHLNAGLTFREISRIVGQPLPTVYKAYRKAIADLRTMLNGGYL